MKKTLLISVFALFVLGIAFVVLARLGMRQTDEDREFSKKGQISAVTETSNYENKSEDSDDAESDYQGQVLPTSTEISGHYSNEEEAVGEDVMVYEVSVGATIDPHELQISYGDIVFFKNLTSKPVFLEAVGGDPYPEFSSGEIQPGKSYQFKFIKVGTWRYHDQHNQKQSAQITVTDTKPQ